MWHMGWNQVARLPSVGIAAFTWQFNKTSLLADVCRRRYLCFYDFIVWWWCCAAYLDCCKEIQMHWPFDWSEKLDYWSVCLIHNNQLNRGVSLMVCGFVCCLLRWLSSTTSSSDRSRPGSCVCVSMRRARTGHQRSQRLVSVFEIKYWQTCCAWSLQLIIKE